ncbi:MAG: nuclear transport factor 2 family protein [Actinomycetota bacterium]|nr:nuclear transport factor 2 family protein [Actinomycetota bacterium]
MTGPEGLSAHEVADHLAVSQLQTWYADVINRRAWPELAQLFADDAPVRIDTVSREPFDLVGSGQVGEFISGAIERFSFFEFVVLNSRINLTIDGDRDAAAARIFMCEIRLETATDEWSTAYGVYHDRYRRTDVGWRFARRDYQSLARTTGEVFDFPHHLRID